MHVLITGGAGFIGSHTARALRSQGHRVRILDRLDPQIHGESAVFPDQLRAVAECIQGSVESSEDCRRALDGIDAVFHFASRTGVGQSMYDIGDYVATNVLGTAILIETIVKMRIRLERFVLASSRAVYGEGMFACQEHGVVHPGLRDPAALGRGDFEVYCPHCAAVTRALPTSTDCGSAPLSVYAMSKWEQEEYCQYAARTFDLPLVVLRYFNVYGSLQSLRNPYTGVISIFYGLLQERRALSLYEGGKPIRDFVHVADVVRANLLALNADIGIGERFNVGTGKAVTIADVARALGAAMGVQPELQDRGEFRVGDIYGCFAELNRSRTILGYEPQVELQQGMHEFVTWASRQPAENKYDVAVSELRLHGLFGQAKR